jgi:hypothetical protein
MIEDQKETKERLLELSFGDSAWFRFVSRRGTTFVRVQRLAVDLFKLNSRYGTLSGVAKILGKSDEQEDTDVKIVC